MCKFCEPEKYKAFPKTKNILEFSPSNSKMKMQGNKIIMEFELNGLEYEATMIVNCCPQCGRKLTNQSTAQQGKGNKPCVNKTRTTKKNFRETCSKC